MLESQTKSLAVQTQDLGEEGKTTENRKQNTTPKDHFYLINFFLSWTATDILSHSVSLNFSVCRGPLLRNS